MYKNAIRPLLFSMDPERAHHLLLEAGRMADRSPALQDLVRRVTQACQEASKTSRTVLNTRFAHPAGLAAGFDKNGVIPHATRAAGFAFTEIGSITALSSPGNPRPRMFRLPRDGALINRMGLNNDGADAIIRRLARRDSTYPLGINIAKTPDPTLTGPAAVRDYVYSYRLARQVAPTYITLNISCPNTEDGQTFEQPGALNKLLQAIYRQRADHAGQNPPLLVKLSPDHDERSLDKALEVCESFGVDGYVAVNTTGRHSNLNTPSHQLQKIGKGGMSGMPLHERKCQVIQFIRKCAGNDTVIIGVGGIHSGQTARETLEAGADLLQLYTGLVYEGPELIRSCAAAGALLTQACSPLR